MRSSETTRFIKAKALELGFSYCGVAKAELLTDEQHRLERWLARDFHGKMSYMKNHRAMRVDPRELLPGAKSVICVMQNYFTKQQQRDPQAPRISKYARGRDYHLVVKEKLQRLLDCIVTEIGPVNGRVCVDSAPVLERAWAARAGLGWIGKNSLLINPKAGSFFFLGELIVDIEMDYDTPLRDHCGRCAKCMAACPTGAIIEPRIVDSRRCISYLTIEYRGDLPEKLRGKLNNWMFGCDICQDACPFNAKSKPHDEPDFEMRPELEEMTRADWKKLSRTTFNKLFAQWAVKRTRFQGLRRNIRFLTENDEPSEK